MPMLGGSTEPWPFSCSLNLASCRQRAETLARQLHSNLWSPRSSFSSDGGSRSVSPSFGFISPAAFQPLVIVERPAVLGKSLRDQGRMSSLDDDEEEDEDAFCLDQSSSRSSEVDIVVTPPSTSCIMSPPKSPQQVTTTGDTQIVPLPRNGDDFFVNFRSDPRFWMPDSPPESFGSESLPSDSPAPTVETEEEHSVTPSSSTETVSEIASPTAENHCPEKGSALADELFSRLRMFESLQVNGRSVFSPPASAEPITEDVDEPSSCTNISETYEDTSKSEDSFLISPEACPRLMRSTSLKSGKTPPDTPNRKKFVRFADALGLDLEAVRHFVEDDDLPLVPSSAFSDLKIPTSVSLPWVSLPGQGTSNFQFLPQFKQPAGDPHFLDKVRLQKVSLENLMVNDLRVTALVRVLNLGFEKQVIARYTTTEWAAHTDLVADYVPQSCDGFSDKFTCTIHLPHLCNGQRLVLAFKYIANGQEFWDNNSGLNYVLRVQPKPKELENNGPIPRWSHHFM